MGKNKVEEFREKIESLNLTQEVLTCPVCGELCEDYFCRICQTCIDVHDRMSAESFIIEMGIKCFV